MNNKKKETRKNTQTTNTENQRKNKKQGETRVTTNEKGRKYRIIRKRKNKNKDEKLGDSFLKGKVRSPCKKCS